MSESDAVPVHFVRYENPSNVEYEETADGVTVTNHDDLDKQGVVRGFERSFAEEQEMDILTPDDPLWREEYADLAVGEELAV